jgi:hypothetical protein
MERITRAFAECVEAGDGLIVDAHALLNVSENGAAASAGAAEMEIAK